MLILFPSQERLPESLLQRPILQSPSPLCGLLCAQLQGVPFKEPENENGL